jgi:hypothetical protein
MELLVGVPPTVTKSAPPALGGKMTPNKPFKSTNDSYFGSDDQEIRTMFGPALSDAESSGFMADFMRAGDAIDYAKVEPTTKNKSQDHRSIDMTNESESYFAFDDTETIHEILQTLGPAMDDVEMSEYMAHILA